MTLEEKKQILSDAETRVYKRITALTDEALAPELAPLLNGLGMLRALVGFRTETAADDEPSGSPAPKPEPESESESESKPETPQYKTEDVRAALLKARKNGFNITGLLREMGANSFPELPASKYHKVMMKLQEA